MRNISYAAVGKKVESLERNQKTYTPETIFVKANQTMSGKKRLPGFIGKAVPEGYRKIYPRHSLHSRHLGFFIPRLKGVFFHNLRKSGVAPRDMKVIENVLSLIQKIRRKLDIDPEEKKAILKALRERDAEHPLLEKDIKEAQHSNKFSPDFKKNAGELCDLYIVIEAEMDKLEHESGIDPEKMSKWREQGLGVFSHQNLGAVKRGHLDSVLRVYGYLGSLNSYIMKAAGYDYYPWSLLRDKRKKSLGYKLNA